MLESLMLKLLGNELIHRELNVLDASVSYYVDYLTAFSYIRDWARTQRRTFISTKDAGGIHHYI